MSHAQQRLWFLNRLEGPNAAYNLPMAVRLIGSLDRSALTAAIADVVARHAQAPPTASRRRRRSLPAHPRPRPGAGGTRGDRGRPDELAAAIAETAERGFDLQRDLPLRVRAPTVSPTEHVLVLVVHHVAGDGWSLVPLTRDLSTAYADRCAARAPRWTELPVQYADYALWQRELLGREDDPSSLINEQVLYWRDALAGIPDELPLPTDRARPKTPSYAGGSVEFGYCLELHARINKLAVDCHATAFMVVQTALASLLTRLGACTDIPIGSPIAGRTDEAFDQLVGFFVNTLVLRPTPAAIRRSARSSTGCGRPTSTPTLTRICRSSTSSRLSTRTGRWPGIRCSR